MEVTNTPDGKLPTETAANAGSTEVARSADSAKRHDLNFITSNNKIDAEYQLPVTADAKGTWVCQLLVGQLRTSRGRPCDVFVYLGSSLHSFSSLILSLRMLCCRFKAFLERSSYICHPRSASHRPLCHDSTLRGLTSVLRSTGTRSVSQCHSYGGCGSSR